MKYKYIHDCKTPKMYRTLAREVEYRTWYGIKRTRIEHYKEYDSRDILWDCEECKSTWNWSPYGKFWMCLHRPEVWKEV